MRSSDVTFKKAEVPIDILGSDDNVKTMDIIEIKYPDGKVVAFPADMKSPETGIRYRDMYQGKYNAFKNGEGDPDRIDQLEREIAERQAELDGMRKAPDDARVQENLGYGTADHHDPFDHMTKAELHDWIAAHSEHAPGDANKDDLVKLAKKVERKQKAAA
jgi:hypothetical protein